MGSRMGLLVGVLVLALATSASAARVQTVKFQRLKGLTAPATPVK